MKRVEEVIILLLSLSQAFSINWVKSRKRQVDPIRRALLPKLHPRKKTMKWSGYLGTSDLLCYVVHLLWLRQLVELFTSVSQLPVNALFIGILMLKFELIRKYLDSEIILK